MRRLFILCLFPCLLAADDHWVKFASGPFEVLTDAGARAGRETMVRFEEFRHALGEIVGEPDLQTPVPVRILVFRNAKGWASPAPLAEGRDCYAIVLAEKSAVPPAVYSELTRLFLKSNTAQMPPAFEHGLAEFFSTFEVSGIHITVGAPPARNPTSIGRACICWWWTRNTSASCACCSTTCARASTRTRLTAMRSASRRPRSRRRPSAISPKGTFQTTSLSSRPMTERDFPEKPISDADARLARADLLAGSQSAAEYQSLLRDGVKLAEAEEGLGLLALAGHRNDEARRHFAASIEAASASARCYIEYAKLEPDDAKAMQALLRAAGINPKLDEPFALMARRDTDPQKRLAHWKAAAERNPRDPSYWQALAECYLADHNYAEAAKAWKEGEQAATDPAQREHMRQARMAIEQQRLDYEEAERKRRAEEEARAIDKLKTQARAELHAIENKYNDGTPKPSDKAVPWWDGPNPSGKLAGTLKQVDCLGSQARLVVEGEGHKTVKLLVTDPRKVAIMGRGELALGCGVQKPRRVAIEYFPKPNARLATAGEVATIEFQ